MTVTLRSEQVVSDENVRKKTGKVNPCWWATLRVERHRGLVEMNGKGKGDTICATKSVKAPPERCWEPFATGEALERLKELVEAG